MTTQKTIKIHPEKTSNNTIENSSATISIPSSRHEKFLALPEQLRNQFHPAQHWQALANQRVKCNLSPHGCNIPPGGLGFCGVRYNDHGKLVTLNYGKSVPMTQETIETEAVYHYAPGSSILSLGNIGCMMNCDFCHNWQTSQARIAKNEDIASYSPAQVVEYALRHNIKILSWTYNDPVVWHEFVVETAQLGRAHGLKNLYKSALYINAAPIDELIDVMDIFSVSLKSMNPDHYLQFTGGKLAPVLAGIEQIYQARKNGKPVHLEVSNLCVTGRNDNLEEAAKVADWMLEKLDSSIPLHYVRFHPDYKYLNVERTNIEFLDKARQQALAKGLQYVYVGNVHASDSANTYCQSCGTVLVSRCGLNASIHLNHNACPSCGSPSPLVIPWHREQTEVNVDPAISNNIQHMQTLTHYFSGAIQAAHIEHNDPTGIYFIFIDNQGKPLGSIRHTTSLRFMIANAYPNSVGVKIYHQTQEPPKILAVLDRAHFPSMHDSAIS